MLRAVHRSNFIFHATDPDTNAIIDFDEFFKRLTEGTGDREAELITQLNTICTVEKITVYSSIEFYFSTHHPISPAGFCQH